MSMLTINETAKRTGLSSYEIRRRVHTGSCPHIRVNGSKILILFDDFIEQLKGEAYKNMTEKKNVIPVSEANITGYEQIRQIN